MGDLGSGLRFWGIRLRVHGFGFRILGQFSAEEIVRGRGFLVLGKKFRVGS